MEVVGGELILTDSELRALDRLAETFGTIAKCELAGTATRNAAARIAADVAAFRDGVDQGRTRGQRMRSMRCGAAAKLPTL
jgi:hypothetical protein